MALWSALDALLLCPLASTPTRPLSLDRVLELVSAVTGIPIGEQGLLALGSRRFRLQSTG